jgi:hypothetical protein
VAQKSITEMDNPLCSLDLASLDFWLFPKIKSALKKRRFYDIEGIKNVTSLKAFPQQEFQKCFQQ